MNRFRPLAVVWTILSLCHFGLGDSQLAAQTPATDWRQFRGPGGLGVSPNKGLPEKWSGTDNVVWKTPLPGAGSSQPIVVGDKIYLTCFSGYGVPGKGRGDMAQLKLHLVCLNRGDGTIAWTTDIAPKLPEQETMRDNHGYASSTPVTDGERIYVHFGKTGAFAFDMNGKKVWQADVGSKLNGFGSGASPVLYDNLLIVNASVESDSLIAFDKTTGDEKWRAKKILEAWNTPTLVPLPGGKTELAVGTPGKVLAFDPATGQQLWSCANEITWYIVPSIVAHDGVLWSLGGRSGVAGIAVRAGGRGDVTQSHRLWKTMKGSNVTSPILHNDHLYWMSDQLGIAYCADAKTGKILCDERLPRADQVYASPILADGKIYYLTRSGRTFVVAATPKFDLIATNDLPDRSAFNASPAVTGNRLLIRSDAFLYCLGTK